MERASDRLTSEVPYARPRPRGGKRREGKRMTTESGHTEAAYLETIEFPRNNSVKIPMLGNG
jgi:hypothetical protein